MDVALGSIVDMMTISSMNEEVDWVVGGWLITKIALRDAAQ